MLLEMMAWSECAEHLLHKHEDLSGVSSIHIKVGHCCGCLSFKSWGMEKDSWGLLASEHG